MSVVTNNIDINNKSRRKSTGVVLILIFHYIKASRFSNICRLHATIIGTLYEVIHTNSTCLYDSTFVLNMMTKKLLSIIKRELKTKCYVMFFLKYAKVMPGASQNMGVQLYFHYILYITYIILFSLYKGQQIL